jgi:hypothetical protein
MVLGFCRFFRGKTQGKIGGESSGDDPAYSREIPLSHHIRSQHSCLAKGNCPDKIFDSGNTGRSHAEFPETHPHQKRNIGWVGGNFTTNTAGDLVFLGGLNRAEN